MRCSLVLPIKAKYGSWVLLPGLQTKTVQLFITFCFCLRCHCFCLILGVLVAAGDVITQQFAERRGTNHDFRRTARMGVVGLVIGPVLRSWYLTLERIVPGTAKTAGFKKMLLDQSLFAPVMICFFFSVSETLAGKRPHEIKEMLQERYVQTLITNYKIWLLAQTLNFTFVPIQHRVGFVQIVAIFWNAYLL